MAQFIPERALDSNGDTIPAELYVYEAGTTTPVTTYSDSALSTANASPLESDASGAWSPVYVTEGEYKIDIKDAEGSSLPGYPKDNVKVGMVSEAGDTMTGNLRIEGELSLDAPSGDTTLKIHRVSGTDQPRILFYSSAGYMHWDLGARTESSNANFSIAAGDGSGSYNGTPVTIGRSAGKVTLAPYGVSTDPALVVNYSSSDTLQIRADGNAYNATGTWGTISDQAWKENITDATPKLDDLDELRVVNYTLKEAYRPTGEPAMKLLGFIAQEVETVFPAMVDVDGDGFKTVKTSVLVPMLVKAIQELKARVEALEA